MGNGTATRLGGRYRLVDLIGTGGMAVVWRARDEVLGRDVAVKLLAADFAADEAFRARIRAEAKAAARLSHPNITSVYDYGESRRGRPWALRSEPTDKRPRLQPARQGRRAPIPYVVMELLDGQPLASRLRDGPMSWREAVTVCAEVAAALAAAHARGVVHRDIKPANVMLTAAGAKVLDFGVAGLAGSPEADEPGRTVFGTPAYLAPERLLGGPVVPATDVYALGLLLYRCLTDRLPWHAETPTQMITNHVYEPPHPLPAIDGLPDDVARLCARCLTKSPAERPTSREIARALADAAGSQVVLPDDDPADAVELTDGVAGWPRSTGREGHPDRRHILRRRSVRLVGAALIVAGLSTALVTCVARAREAGSPVPQAYACHVELSIFPEGAGLFTARLTVSNTGRAAFPGWRLDFQFGGFERVAGVDGARWTQSGQLVTVTGDIDLPPGLAATAALHGTGGRRGFPPSGFAVNGTPCISQVNEGPPGGPPPPQPGGPPSGDPTPNTNRSGPSGGPPGPPGRA